MFQKYAFLLTRIFLSLLLVQATFLVGPHIRVNAADDDHEYAHIQQKTVSYRDGDYQDIKTDQRLDLRNLMGGKKLVLVVYFAPWCPNWKNESPIVERVYNKYKGQGFEVIGISEYGSREDVKSFFGLKGPEYTVLTDSESRDARLKTEHYNYRTAAGDKRKWGSPWNIFLEPSKLNHSGPVLTSSAWIANGELIESEADDFIKSHLNPDTSSIGSCKQ